ncbi:hypothetical protein HY948_03705, partial [Candidatus Gottesmanbacteria bacterium]|nr:hypothetical protein [Candidatus Gottesmanbacteria bacterium]
MKKFFIYPLLLAFIAGIVAGANYTPGTFLSGWDTLHPEFNVPLAFSRIFTGVWRADQGLGAVAIQSHIADLPRVFLLFLGSFLMPVNLLRYASFLVTLAVGPVGIYWLTEHLLIKQHGSHRHFIAFFCALTYLFNLGTVQHFIVPLEMFAFHYALLPWLLFTGLLTLESGSRKSFLAFTLITLLAAPQAHTATLFYAYFGVFTLFVGAWILSSDQKFRALKRGTMLITAILLLNAYWLLPNIYAVATKSNAVRTSKVNALFSDEAFAKNQKFGTIADAALIKNFLFDWQLVDPKTNAQIDVMAAWSDHLMRHPIALAYGYTVFFLVWTGFVYALWKKQRILLNFAPVFIIPFLMLLNGTWPMTLVLARIKESAPVLGEAMRFSFTKFSILYMAASSLFAGIGLLQILRLIKQVSVIRVTKATIIVLSFYYFLPAFGGNLVHPSMRVNIPPAYFDTFSWFQKQNPDRRVAILPVFSFWNWINYSWGYQGAGFLQFGIPQPILDRDYDRWSPMNENYYWELSQALYSEDATAFDAVLRKYDVHYLLLDENVISRDHGRSLYIDQTKTLLSQIPTITIAKSFGKVTIYERNNEVSPSFVSLKTNLPTV